VVHVPHHLSDLARGAGGADLSSAAGSRLSLVGSDELPFGDAPPEIVAAMGGRVPTLQQWRAITHPLAPCCVVAGAGSGKTAVMAARVVYLALAAMGRVDAEHRGAMPSSVLCLTFTNKAAEELSRRVREATAPLGLAEGEEATVLTYHAFAARLLDDHGLREGIEPGSMLLSEAQRWQLAASLLADRELEYLEVRSEGHVVRLILALADACQNHLVEPEAVAAAGEALAAGIEPERAADRDLRETALERAELAGLVGAYRARKRELGAIDYGDQIRLAVDLVRAHPDVAEAFRARFGVVLLDEYQDTNRAQAVLLRALCGPDHPLTAVGDPDQNIYAWRGASLRNILEFLPDFCTAPDPGAARPLYVNFRSGSSILAAANAVITPVPEERRAPDKLLRPHPSRGTGRVLSFVETDERAEGRRIAGLIRELLADRPAAEDGQPAWSDVAILCRKRKLFTPIAEALRDEQVPVEVVDLGGLLRLPEVVDVLAWLRVLDDPARNVALARLLRSPRWRIGHRDLVALARWSAEHNSRLRDALSEATGEDVDRPGDVAFALAESLDHLDDPEMTGLSTEGRDRLEEFRIELQALRESARGPLADLVVDIVERSGLLRELEAAGTPAAQSARLNLLNLVDHVAAFSPVQGEASLSTLVSYLDVAEEGDEELEPAQPSATNTVKVLTVHKAKGLEWPIVFVPGMAEHRLSQSSLFPDVSRQPNPVTRPETLPFELRDDASGLPSFTGDPKQFREDLRERALEEERRLCYVALTRARDVLVVSASHWYEGPAEPFVPSRFLEEIEASGVCELIGHEDPPQASPITAARAERLRGWPTPARADDRDEVFPEGWRRFAQEAADDPAVARGRAEELGPAVLAGFDRAMIADRERAALIEGRTGSPRQPGLPSSLSVSRVIDYLRCPKFFYWSVVRPLPRRPGEAARVGSELHRWIELQSRGQATLLDVEDLPDLSIQERTAEPPSASRMKETFRSSRFAQDVPIATERPFALYVDGFVVGGRVDAIFALPGGRWEIVDYKTGRKPDEEDVLSGLQLDCYALAAQEVWGKDPADLTLTYFYLASGEEVSRGAVDAAATRSRIVRALNGMAAGSFDPVAGPYCRWCDFLSFCDPGRAYLAAGPGPLDGPGSGPVEGPEPAEGPEPGPVEGPEPVEGSEPVEGPGQPPGPQPPGG
jgi:DNA helicase II / ATP-dependent DNA helicase PcrA